ncbi:Zinc finger CCHC domain-containing protein 9 [Nibea albiflora]|uniref:Zinc finger CCHC domain-containing protein 9 n=1 Tax=Nibea albiflora TaxID=240163 RepID=A0ACB7F857_NIBAL|nr:Zinc finger CCHC domain-containing protein 9 [Nibea albiflora]
MTRWARANNVHKHKPAEATPWSQLRGGGGGGRGGGGHSGPSRGPQRDHLRGTQPGGSAVKKPNRKKKEYVDEDVNGFMEKPGHGLADCPEADRDEEMGRGICYRCGSTEHEIQRCRAKVDPALASSVTVAWLSNNMSADHEEVHVPVKKAKPKQTKVVTF